MSRLLILFFLLQAGISQAKLSKAEICRQQYKKLGHIPKNCKKYLKAPAHALQPIKLVQRPEVPKVLPPARKFKIKWVLYSALGFSIFCMLVYFLKRGRGSSFEG